MLTSKADLTWESGFILCCSPHGGLPHIILWVVEMPGVSSQGNFSWKNNGGGGGGGEERTCMMFIASFYIKLKI